MKTTDAKRDSATKRRHAIFSLPMTLPGENAFFFREKKKNDLCTEQRLGSSSIQNWPRFLCLCSLCLCLCRCLASERRDTESADLQHRGQLQLTQQADEAAAWKHREGYTMLTTGVIGTKQTER